MHAMRIFVLTRVVAALRHACAAVFWVFSAATFRLDLSLMQADYSSMPGRQAS